MNIQTFYNSFRDMELSGVSNLASVPHQISTAQLPAKYVKYIDSQFNIATLQNKFGLPNHTFDIVFLIEPVGQNTNIINQTLCMTIADNIYAALDTIDFVVDATITSDIQVINAFRYWALTVTVGVIDDGN